MTIRTILAAAGALSLTLGAAPAMAKINQTPPGNPCAKANGNPCKGNNGNLGRQGNAGNKSHNHNPPPINTPLPPVSGRAAFVTQIGELNRATIVQSAPNAFANVHQDGAENEAEIGQRGLGTGYVEAKQAGARNVARVEQDGVGQNVLHLNQTGNGNWAYAGQTANGAIHNGAIMTQAGNNNDMLLLQDGSDNRAQLTQDGNNNGMTAIQNGEGNRLVWTQQGNGLSDLGITQNGGQAIQITQTHMGNGPGGNGAPGQGK